MPLIADASTASSPSEPVREIRIRPKADIKQRTSGEAVCRAARQGFANSDCGASAMA